VDGGVRTRRAAAVFLRKERSDRGKSRLSVQVDAILEIAIKIIYLTEEQPDVAAVIEEVNLQCLKQISQSLILHLCAGELRCFQTT
jgi:hypothetical protein